MCARIVQMVGLIAFLFAISGLGIALGEETLKTNSAVIWAIIGSGFLIFSVLAVGLAEIITLLRTSKNA